MSTEVIIAREIRLSEKREKKRKEIKELRAACFNVLRPYFAYRPEYPLSSQAKI